jgi:hypothetical protein
MDIAYVVRDVNEKFIIGKTRLLILNARLERDQGFSQRLF